MIVSEKERVGIEQDLFSQEFLTTNTNEKETVIADKGRLPFLDEFSFEEPSLKETSIEGPSFVTPSVEDISLEASSLGTIRKKPFRGRPMKRKVSKDEKETLPEAKKYLTKINPDTLEKITMGVIDALMLKKGYKDRNCSARQLAKQLGTNTRYISIAIRRRFHVNYSSLVNKLRVEEAMSMLSDKRYVDYRMEDISDTVGFANRQTFNASFLKYCGMTPSEYSEKVGK